MTQQENDSESTKRSGVSRREFIAGTVGGVVVGAAVGAAAGSLGFPRIVTKYQTQTQTQTTTSVTTAQPWLPAKWDYTADVVIVGDGFAGLNAAIAAHDAGANVLVLEKMDQGHEGGTSKVCGGVMFVPTNATTGATYIATTEAGQLTDSTITSAIAQGLVANPAAITKLGGTLTQFSTNANGTLQVLTANGQNALGGGLLYQFWRGLASSRSINVMYSTPATSLIQNSDTKEILGVSATTSGGSTINVKASKAVVLATGSIDYNPAMQSQFLAGYPVRSWGGLGNTGDGIRMAQQVGADLWHMSHPASVGAGVAMSFPDYPYTMGTTSAPGIGNNYLWTDRKGSRFVNETSGSAAYEYMVQYDTTDGVFLRIPTWVIFDDTARAKGPFVNASTVDGWFLTYSGYTWSKDNSAEIAKGWITKADSIADLATAIGSDKDNQNAQGQPMMTPATLQATITRFNGFVTAGADADFGRAASTMAQIQTAPFYAVKTWPSAECLKGGPRRNANCQVVDPSGNPIPRLYSAGMCGSFWGGAGVGGGNIAEAVWTGRTAGTNAAAATPWS